ncbi:hypothetical protein K450DRAFT_223678 [Umbelopsis ramanniana AG]|uniref:TPX2 C-terminal domain-containing protein n=1 Tax=Umbelopsis ramanniana AG TaxID=1314678 RepID=A0AAD5EJE5_UMBRA|nr:uncharacterized protein K450DRAFT_223678 [Umbelopsis ramanniana AG]KAI8583435.1 hypothetical protein K450DRAFT_223678 [Umbelopsis ramanniana AG]
MHPNSSHRHSSFDLSFEEGVSFLETERETLKHDAKASEPHWLFDQPDPIGDEFLPNSPSQIRQQRATIEHTPSYAQQTFTSSIASSKRQSTGYISPLLEKSAPLASPARRTLATPLKLHSNYSSKTYTPVSGLKRKRSLASSPYESTTQTNALEEIVENAISSEEPFVPLSERLRRYEEEVEEKSSTGQSPDRRSIASPHALKPSPKGQNGTDLTLHNPRSPSTRDARASVNRSSEYETDLLSKLSPYNHSDSFKKIRYDHTDDALSFKHDVQPEADLAVPGESTSIENWSHTSPADIGTRQLRVIDDLPPMPDIQPRRSTMSKRSHSQVSRPQPLSRTIPQPFTFATDVRGEQHQRQFQEKLRQWKDREEEAHRFKPAGPPPRFDRPFQVKRSTKPLTDAQNMVFHSEIRSLERKMAEDERRIQRQLNKATSRKRRRVTSMVRIRSP